MKHKRFFFFFLFKKYSSEHRDQDNVKKKSKCEITFYFKAS